MLKGAPHDLLADLTPAQREAVSHFEGPLLIYNMPSTTNVSISTDITSTFLEK